MAIEAVLLGQALAAAQQVPGQRAEGVVQGHLTVQLGHRQVQAIAAGIEQAVAAFGLADVAGHQGQVGGQLAGQLQQGDGLALAQLQFQLADFFLPFPGDHLAQVQRGFDHRPGLAAAPGDLRLLPGEVGAEEGRQLFLVQLGQAGRPAAVIELFQIQFGLAQVPVPLVALGQAGNTLAAGLQGLDDLLAVAAQAQGNLGLGQITGGGVVVLIEQLALLPATLVALLEQGVVTQGVQGFATDPQFDFGFFVHADEDQCLV